MRVIECLTPVFRSKHDPIFEDLDPPPHAIGVAHKDRWKSDKAFKKCEISEAEVMVTKGPVLGNPRTHPLIEVCYQGLWPMTVRTENLGIIKERTIEVCPRAVVERTAHHDQTRSYVYF